MITIVLAMAVAGLLTGRLLGRSVTTVKKLRKAGGAASLTPARRDPAEPDMRFRGLLCSPGDVILLASGEEAWLAGAALFREHAADTDEGGDVTRTASALFVAPGKVLRAVYACPEPDASLDWLVALPDGVLTAGLEPPSTLEHAGVRFERTRRLPLAVECVGEDTPDLGKTVVLGEYTGGAGARLLLVLGASGGKAWTGSRLEPGLYDILPGGKEDEAKTDNDPPPDQP